MSVATASVLATPSPVSKGARRLERLRNEDVGLPTRLRSQLSRRVRVTFKEQIDQAFLLRRPLELQASVAIICGGRGYRDIRAAVYRSHQRRFSVPVQIVVLHDTQSINPDVGQPEFSGCSDGVPDRLRQSLCRYPRSKLRSVVSTQGEELG
jgi:hypothetical protein